MAASKVSAIPAVRVFLLDLQKEMAAKNNVVMDGRDIGTVYSQCENKNISDGIAGGQGKAAL